VSPPSLATIVADTPPASTVTAASAPLGLAKVRLNTIVGPWFLGPYRAASRARGVLLSYAVLRADAETSARRVRERDSGGSKAEPVVLDLHRQFSDLGELESHVIDSNTLSAEKLAEQVRSAVAEGRLALR